jgi:hypothetical protein
LKKGYLLVEGHGETEAAHNLVSRVCQERELPIVWAPPLRWINLHQERGLRKAVEFIRCKRDAEAMLILRDEDDACPKEIAPKIARVVESLAPPCPVAIVLLHPEYEVLFLPCLSKMAGKRLGDRPGLGEDTQWDGASWEERRGIKEWLSKRMPKGRSYKPTLDQLPMTRMLDFGLLRAASVPCFGTLERAVTFLARIPESTVVYPPAI